ncbi:MAG: CBS domain-containing protein [Saprospiraceae bacterium]
MTARTLIAHDIPALNVEQTGREAFHTLNDHHVRHLPVVDGGKLVGLLSEEEIFNHKLSDPLSEHDFSMLPMFQVLESEHIFQVIKIMGDHRLTVIPVVDAEGNYLGLVQQNDLLRYFAHTASLTEHGAVLVLGMPRRDYALSTIARIFEEENVRILSAFVTSAPHSDDVELTLKLDRHDLARAIASLDRHDFEVKKTFGETDRSELLRDRYDALMHYLNV